MYQMNKISDYIRDMMHFDAKQAYDLVQHLNSKTDMTKTKIGAQIVAHSVNKQGDELISVLATFPRIILSEVNTHRMLSKNTSSSRAIPFRKMVESVQNDPFIPIAWQKVHSGMQGTEYITDVENYFESRTSWLRARDRAVFEAKTLTHVGVTKQLANRLLEPFMWTTMLLTGSREGWENFFHLRCPQYTFDDLKFYKSKKDAMIDIWGEENPSNPASAEISKIGWLKFNKSGAEIHISALAECIWDALNESTPRVLGPGEWHIPFEDKIQWSAQDGEYTTYIPETLVKISTAMAARTSYTVVGDEKGIDYERMIALHDMLLAQDPPHSSPLEHCARAMTEIEYTGSQSTGLSRKGNNHQQAYGWCNNLKGFVQYRYMVDNGYKL